MKNEDRVLVVMMSLVFALIAFVVVFFLSLPFISSIGRVNGTHTGMVTAVEESGVVWLTKRAYVKTSSESTQEDTYCVQDQAVYEQLREKANTSERVTIQFSNPLIEWNWNCGRESATITSVN